MAECLAFYPVSSEPLLKPKFPCIFPNFIDWASVQHSSIIAAPKSAETDSLLEEAGFEPETPQNFLPSIATPSGNSVLRMPDELRAFFQGLRRISASLGAIEASKAPLFGIN
jgi:hypothetical protein